MSSDEETKKERLRTKNRAAAARCRHKMIEKMTSLAEKEQAMYMRTLEQEAVMDQLTQDKYRLEALLENHACKIVMTTFCNRANGRKSSTLETTAEDSGSSRHQCTDEQGTGVGVGVDACGTGGGVGLPSSTPAFSGGLVSAEQHETEVPLDLSTRDIVIQPTEVCQDKRSTDAC